MARKRIKVVVELDLDYIPGEMYSRESARKTVQAILDRQLPHYDPAVHTDPNHDPRKDDY